jgi:hypothetical protein
MMHLRDTFCRLRNEKDHQRHDSSIEAAIREGQSHGVALLELGDVGGVSRAGVGELRLGRVDALHLGRRAAVDQQLGERAIAAADIDPAQAGLWRDPVEKHVARQPAPDSHHAFIAGAIVEANLVFGHASPSVPVC